MVLNSYLPLITEDMESSDNRESGQNPGGDPQQTIERQAAEIAELKSRLAGESEALEAALEKLENCRGALSKLEAQIERGKEYYRLSIEKMLNGFTYNQMILDDKDQPKDFIMLEVNESFLKSTKLKREEIIGVPVTSYIPEVKTIKPDLIDLAAQVALKGESFHGEVYFETFGKWFEISAYSTKAGFFNVVYKDVTQRKQAEAELEHSKAYLEYSLNSAPDGILIVGQNLRYTYINPAFTRLFGVEEPDILGKTALELAPNLLAEKESRWIHAGTAALLKSGESYSGYEFELKHPEGMMIPASFSAAGIRDPNNEVIGVIIFVKDISERKRTQELMIQTEKMMSVGGLAAGMAHEINNPLGGMLQGAQNVIRRLSPDLPANQKDARESGLDLGKMAVYIKRRKVDEMLEGIIGSGKRAARIINNMLLFSRQSESNLCPNDINELIDEVLELSANDYDLVKRYDFRKIDIVKVFDSNLPRVPCTKTEIEQVFFNLFKNAAHAMMQTADERPPRLEIRTVLEDAHVRIEVEDNGPGMTEEVRNRIFEPFYTTKAVGKGTGLGLSVSYMIITNNHKGMMEVASSPGEGAFFTIRLPLKNKAVS